MSRSDKIAELKERLLKCSTISQDPNLFMDLRTVMICTHRYTEETRQELIQIARQKRYLFTRKQLKHINDGFQDQVQKNLAGMHNYYSNSDEEVFGVEAPELIDDYDYEEYF